MKNENIKLMIATMIVDGKLFIDEFELIKVFKAITEIDDLIYDELTNEANEIISCGYDASQRYDAVINWSQPAIDTLLVMNDPAVCRVVISNMILVANADGNLTDIEIDFIEYCAMFLDISVPKLR